MKVSPTDDLWTFMLNVIVAVPLADLLKLTGFVEPEPEAVGKKVVVPPDTIPTAPVTIVGAYVSAPELALVLGSGFHCGVPVLLHCAWILRA